LKIFCNQKAEYIPLAIKNKIVPLAHDPLDFEAAKATARLPDGVPPPRDKKYETSDIERGSLVCDVCGIDKEDYEAH